MWPCEEPAVERRDFARRLSPWCPPPGSAKKQTAGSERVSSTNPASLMVGETGFEPATPWSRIGGQVRPNSAKRSQAADSSQERRPADAQPFHEDHSVHEDSAAALLLTDGGPARLMTAAEVGLLLQVSRATVYRMATTGELPGIRVLNCVRFDRLTLASFLRTHRRTSTSRRR